MTEHKTNSTLPAGVQDRHIKMAEYMQDFALLHSKVMSGSASQEEVALLKSIPQIAARPQWVSELSEEDRTGMQKAINYLNQQ